MRSTSFLTSLIFVLRCSALCAFVVPSALTVVGRGLDLLHDSASAPTHRTRWHLGAQEPPSVDADAAPPGSLVLIEVSKKHAKVFKSVAKGSVPEIVEPVDEWRVHEAGNKEKRSQGMGKHHAEKPDPVMDPSYLVKFYMDELEGIVTAADSVLLVGHGHAKANVAEGLAQALCARYPELTDKIADVLRLDGKHITQNQLLKLGRRHLLHSEDPRKQT